MVEAINSYRESNEKWIKKFEKRGTKELLFSCYKI
jgi:hypothetical protein